MATTVGKFIPPPELVSMTDGKFQMQFGSPADLVDYLDLNPEILDRIAEFRWTTLPMSDSQAGVVAKWPT